MTAISFRSGPKAARCAWPLSRRLRWGCHWPPPVPKTIRWARVGDALTLDPHSQNEGPTHTLAHHIYETLVGRATDGSLTPRLATEWGIHPDDSTVWVFKLREGCDIP